MPWSISPTIHIYVVTSRSTGTIVTARGRGSITAIDSPCFRLLVKLMNSRCHFTLLEVFSESSPNVKFSPNGGREVSPSGGRFSEGRSH